MKRILFILTMVLTCLNISAQKTIRVGERCDLHYSTTYIPNTTFSPGSWSSSSSKVRIVSQNGWDCTVEGVEDSDGHKVDIWITVYQTSSGSTYTNKCLVEYIIVEANAPKSVTVSPSSLDLNIGESYTLSASVSPRGVPSSLSWKSDNSSIASVNNSGTVTGMGKGKTYVTVTTNNGKSDFSTVSVFATNPTQMNITQIESLTVGNSQQLTPTFDDAYTRSTVTWTSSNASIAEVSSSGVVTAKWPGTVTITARSANGLTATSTIKVVEPPFYVTATNPENNSYGVDVLSSCAITFSLPIHTENSSNIKLTEGGKEVKGQLTINGNTVTFKPDKAMLPLTEYTLSVPQGTILNEWGTAFPTYQLKFYTDKLHPMTLTSSIAAGFVEAGEKPELTASETGAAIYYTLDGTEPTTQSSLYTHNAIVIDHNLILRAKAFKDGYETPEFKAEYKLTTIRVAQKYPEENNQLYLYKDVNPFVEFTFDVEKGHKLSECNIVTMEGQSVAGAFILNGRHLSFVPEQPLALGKKYIVTIPEGAVMLNEDDQNKALSWAFVSGLFYRKVSAGYDHYYAIRTDNELYCWGEYAISPTNDYGYTNVFYTNSPINIASNVKDVSTGLTHGLFTKFDGSLYGRGVQYSGELGNGSEGTMQGAPILLQENVSLFTAGAQTTTFLQKGKLKGAGRNDFYQIRQNAGPCRSVVEETDVQIADVKVLESGFGNTYALTTGGTLYGWGDNSFGQLLGSSNDVEDTAVTMMEDVDTVAASKWREGNVAVIKRDHSLWTWGNNRYGQLGSGTHTDSDKPIKIMDDVAKVAVGDYCMAAITNSGELWMWGRNNNQLGIDNTSDGSDVTTPTKVMDSIVDVSLGNECTLVIDQEGSIYRWGLIRTGTTVDKSLRTPSLFRQGRSSQSLTSVSIVNSSIQMPVGSQAVACAKPVPLNANYTTWLWTTSDASVAAVSDRGVVTGVGEGQATITLTSDEGKTATCQVMVSGTADGITEIADPSAAVFDVYDLQGHKVRSQVTTVKGLPRGIYIIGGRKVVIQ